MIGNRFHFYGFTQVINPDTENSDAKKVELEPSYCEVVDMTIARMCALGHVEPIGNLDYVVNINVLEQAEYIKNNTSISPEDYLFLQSLGEKMSSVVPVDF